MTFSGRHYETGTIINAIGQLSDAPHVDEAAALGASGGVTFGYFTFEYKGYLPHLALLGRNTFSPFIRALDNLGVVRDVRQTTDGRRAEDNLRLELDAGHCVIVWADIFSLSHRMMPKMVMWAMTPMLVTGHDGDGFFVVGGSAKPVHVPTEEMAKARGIVKKDRHQMMVLERVDESRWNEGFADGLKACSDLFLEKPPAGSTKNFGLTGMDHFAEMLVGQRNKDAWARYFNPGPRLYQALVGMWGQPGLFDWIESWGSGDGADRAVYADFLDQAAVRLDQAGLAEAAGEFRVSHGLWKQLAEATLPDDIPALAEAKMLKRQFSKQKWEGDFAAARQTLDRLKELREAVTETEPVDADRLQAMGVQMSEIVREIRAVEERAARRL
jgi:hypothetical protein